VFNTPYMTNNQGGPVYNNTSSMIMGSPGTKPLPLDKLIKVL
jgi:hypothetical protein